MTTPKMGLAEPQPGITNDLIAAQNIVDNFSIIDDHDHSPGKGGLVPTAGLNINSDLPFNAFQARNMQASNYASLSVALTGAANNRSLFVVGNELVFRDGAGNTVTLTSGGSVAGASGTITGLTGAAQVTYVAPTINFIQDATSRRMIVEHSNLRLFPDVSSPAQNVTLRVPTTLSTTWTLTLPNAVPPGLRYLAMDTAGDVSYATGDDIVTAATSVGANAIIADATTAGGNATLANSFLSTATATGADAVLTTSTSTGANSVLNKYTRPTGTTVAARGVAISNSSNASITSATFVDVTNLNVTITTNGRPLFVTLIGSGSGSSAGAINLFSSSTVANRHFIGAELRLVRDGIFTVGDLTVSSEVNLANLSPAITLDQIASQVAPGSFIWVVTGLSAGTYAFKIQALCTTTPAGGSIAFQEVRLMAYEL